MSTTVRKVCMIGDFAVGKTSLVSHYVHKIFSDRYLTTVGVKIDTKTLELDRDVSLKLVLWDIAGTDAFSSVEQAYLRGAAGYVMVADGTRRETLANAASLQNQARETLGEVPFILLLNKMDLKDAWEVTREDLPAGIEVIYTSARTGEGVETAFRTLARYLMGV